MLILFPIRAHPCHPWSILWLLVFETVLKFLPACEQIARIPRVPSRSKTFSALTCRVNEKLYENALVIELVARGHGVEQQREYPVHYRGHFIGKLVPDLIVDGKVSADPKVVSAFNDSHLAQMLGYLNITGLEVALLLNFKEAKLTWKRVVTGASEKGSTTGEPAGP